MRELIEKYKAFDKFLLIEANEAAVTEGRSRYIDRSVLKVLPIHLMYLVKHSFYHKKGEMRLEVLLNNNVTAYLDVSVLRYNTLPIVGFYNDGSHETEYSERPYPGGKEWVEVVKRQPRRKQAVFRKVVLEAYQNCCALCDTKEKRLLRAAHIVDVTLGGPDVISNGILLCANHEIAFDNGIVRINPDYTVCRYDEFEMYVSKMRLPLNRNDYPSPDLLEQKLKIIAKKKQ